MPGLSPAIIAVLNRNRAARGEAPLNPDGSLPGSPTASPVSQRFTTSNRPSTQQAIAQAPPQVTTPVPSAPTAGDAIRRRQAQEREDRALAQASGRGAPAASPATPSDGLMGRDSRPPNPASPTGPLGADRRDGTAELDAADAGMGSRVMAAARGDGTAELDALDAGMGTRVTITPGEDGGIVEEDKGPSVEDQAMVYINRYLADLKVNPNAALSFSRTLPQEVRDYILKWYSGFNDSDEQKEILRVAKEGRAAGASSGTTRDNRPLTRETSTVTPTSTPVQTVSNALTQANQAAIAAPTNTNPAIRTPERTLQQEIALNAERSGYNAAQGLPQPEFQTPEIDTGFGEHPVPDRPVSPIETAIQSFILQRLQADEMDPVTQAELAEHERGFRDRQKETSDYLQRLGLLRRGGGAQDVLSKFMGEEERSEQEIRGRAEERKRALLSSALGYQGQFNDVMMREAELAGQLRGTPTLPAQLAQADVGLQLGELDRRQREFEFNANLARMQEQQNVANQTLARQKFLTETTDRERFEEAVRSGRVAEMLQLGSQTGYVPSAIGSYGPGLEGGRTLASVEQQGRLGGYYGGAPTLQNRLSTAELLGRMPAGLGAGERTVAGREQSSLAGSRQFRDQLALADMRGVVGENLTGGQTEQTLGARLAEAEQTGYLANRTGTQIRETLGRESLEMAQEMGLAELLGKTSDGRETLESIRTGAELEEGQLDRLLLTAGQAIAAGEADMQSLADLLYRIAGLQEGRVTENLGEGAPKDNNPRLDFETAIRKDLAQDGTKSVQIVGGNIANWKSVFPSLTEDLYTKLSAHLSGLGLTPGNYIMKRDGLYNLQGTRLVSWEEIPFVSPFD